MDYTHDARRPHNVICFTNITVSGFCFAYVKVSVATGMVMNITDLKKHIQASYCVSLLDFI